MAFDRLVTIMDELREQCPWDREQTFESLRKLTIEETYELAGAIVEKDMNEIRVELGDLLLHIVFYTRLAREQQAFTLAEMINGLCDKLIYRHPHVYGETQVKNAGEVMENWEKLKLKEGKNSVLSGVPESLPALTKAFRIQEKVRGIGFDWTEKSEVWEKVKEEITEVKEALKENQQTKNPDNVELEFGDLLFSLVNAARLYGLDPEIALERSNRKFIRRFRQMEDISRNNGTELKALTLEEMEDLWRQTKAAEQEEKS
ncbi:MAG: nucleoside triphosphate pyrophosphohydrolase [Chlorobi bacterium]|nr:nucleoside triphosphate pyrophosphohydrolase [Chlorobiota bacterium]